jgi:hypothetical protein
MTARSPRLTALMTEALRRARHAPLRRVHAPGPGRPPWPASPATLHALVRHELVAVAVTRNRDGWPVDTWTLTTAGRLVLDPPPRRVAHRAKFLAHSTDEHGHLQPAYTDDPRRAMRDDGGAIERVDPAEVQFLVSPRVLARRARELAAFAQRAGLDDELAALRRALADIERRRRVELRDAA